MRLRAKKNKAQAITEYAVLLGIIVLAIVLVQVYLKRSVQGKFKSTADDIGEQFTTGENYTLQTVQQSARRETSGIAANNTTTELNKTWSKSEIQGMSDSKLDMGNFSTMKTQIGTAGINVSVMSAYAGHEITQHDYVKQDVKGYGKLGEHTVFDSGKLSTKSVFNESEGN